MSKFTKSIALALTLAMSLSLAACGNGQQPPAASPEETAQADATQAPEAEGEQPAADASASTGRLASIKSAKKLVMGCSADFPPYEFIDFTTGKEVIAGFDISLAKEICADLGVELEISNMAFDGLLVALQMGKVDIVISGMNATDERKQAVDFSDEYFYADQVLLVRKAEVDSLATADAFNGKKVGSQLGSIQEGVANDQLKTIGAEMYNIANVQNLVMELKTKKIDGVVLDKPIADAFLRQNDDLALSACPLKGEDSGFAIAVAKGNEDLVAAINGTLARLKTENKIDAYFVEANDLAAAQGE